MFRQTLNIDQLVNEMLDKIPNLVNSNVLDPSMGGGQFMKEVERRKREAGLSVDKIRDSCYGFCEDTMDLNYVKNKYKLVGRYRVGNFLEEDTDMKNFVILSNPPYQNANPEASSGKMWIKFVKKALELSDGPVAMITPNSWTKGDIAPRGAGGLFSVFKERGLVAVNNIDCGQHFPGVGVTFSYFILNSKHDKDKFLLTQNGKTLEVPMSTRMIPKNIDALSIVSKFFSPERKKIDHTLVTNLRNHHIEFGEGDIQVVSNGKVLSAKTAPYDTDEKIIIPWANQYDKGIKCGNYVAGDSTVYLYTNGRSSEMMSVLTSKLYMFCLRHMQMANHNEPVRSFPAVDFTRMWTDEDLYKHFKLTEKEIALIEKSK